MVFELNIYEHNQPIDWMNQRRKKIIQLVKGATYQM